MPASYGDATGGIVSITTRGPSSVYYGGIDALSSGFKIGDNIYGLDAFASSTVEAYLAGPILFKRDSSGKKDKPLLGFFVSGNFTHVEDPNPSYIGSHVITEETKQALLNDPLTPIGGNSQGAFYNSDFVRESDLEFTKTKVNAARTSASMSGKIDVTTTPTINLTVGGNMNFNRGRDWTYANSLFNSDNNQLSTFYDWRTYARFTQRFTDPTEEEDNASAVKNAYYSVMVDYSKSFLRQEDDTHGDNLFNYGHVGFFESDFEKTYAPVDPTPNGVQGDEYYVMTGNEEVRVYFTPNDANRDLAAITTGYFNLHDEVEGFYENKLQVQTNGGLLNGQIPRNVYGLWNNIGTQNNNYRVRDRSQFRVTASGAADIGDHEVKLGIEYEQRLDREFIVAPVGLWTRMRLLANSHIRELDNNPNHELRDNDSTFVGYFEDTTIPMYDYSYNRGDDQSSFDRNLRLALGLDPDGLDQINIDNLNPELFSLDMFSATELFNNGGNFVDYYGYNYDGTKQTSRPSFEDFFTARDEETGVLTRPIAPFEPIYMAGYVMDKFALDDIVFNVGLRLDRYDANQKVLKDPYLMREARTAGELRTSGGELGGDIPGSVGDDYVVYVDDFKDPNAITGYRDGEQWFNAQGQPINDPKAIRGNSGEIQPYLIDPDNDELTPAAFKDYAPQYNLMPRIAFSFPISDEAVFFAHYDILTQRPTSNSRLNMINYLFADQVNYQNGINNPNLRPTRTIDYEFGFQQALNKSSALKIAIFYRDMRDMIQARSINEAYPQTYITFDNIDFGTVKGTTISYDLRKTGNVTFKASYTLQFADGTGSNPQTGIALARTQQPNLRTVNPLNIDQRHRINATIDYRYGSGKDYNGPEILGKKVFERTGVNLNANLGSGTPYSARIRNSNGQPGPIDGSLNGSRLPWEFTTDLVLDKTWPVKLGKDDGDAKRPATFNLYLLVNNLFNTRNIYAVHSITGNPDDDGFLESAQAQLIKSQQADPESYEQLYRINMNNPNFYGRPRTIRLGARLNF